MKQNHAPLLSSAILKTKLLQDTICECGNVVQKGNSLSLDFTTALMQTPLALIKTPWMTSPEFTDVETRFRFKLTVKWVKSGF